MGRAGKRPHPVSLRSPATGPRTRPPSPALRERARVRADPGRRLNDPERKQSHQRRLAPTPIISRKCQGRASSGAPAHPGFDQFCESGRSSWAPLGKSCGPWRSDSSSAARPSWAPSASSWGSGRRRSSTSADQAGLARVPCWPRSAGRPRHSAGRSASPTLGRSGRRRGTCSGSWAARRSRTWSRRSTARPRSS